MPRQSLITYEGLPMSGGGAHRLRGKGLSAWTQVAQFLKECTDFDQPEQIVLELLEHSSVTASFLHAVRQRFEHGFTLLRSRRIGNCVGHQWLVPPEQMESTLEFAKGLGPLPRAPLPGLSALSIYATMTFRFVDPATREVLPFQDPSDYLNQDARFAGHPLCLGSSLASARLSERSTLAVFFSLPFLDPNPDFLRYLEFLASRAPFKFSGQHWKIWNLNKKNSGYVPRKSEVPTSAPWGLP
jgi:hypothetical protein